jgi:4'-phosphopantetheinyl transferase
VLSAAVTSPRADPAPPPACGALTPSERRVDLWFARCDGAADWNLLRSYRALLTDDERRRERGLATIQDRAAYLVSRALLHTVLPRYAAAPFDAWRFDPDECGTPAILDGPRDASDISWQLSQSGGAMVLAVTRRSPLAVDIENVRGLEALLEAADDCAAPAGTPVASADGCATLEDAYRKALGVGWPQEPAGADGAECGTWRFWQLNPTPEYLVSLWAGRPHSGAMQTLAVRQSVPLVADRRLDYVLTRYSD